MSMKRGDSRRPRIAVTIGDINGIGPEIILRTIGLFAENRPPADLIVISPPEVVRFWNQRLHLLSPAVERSVLDRGETTTGVSLVEPDLAGEAHIAPGIPSPESGRVAGQAIIKAHELVASGAVDAIVTAPISKQALHAAGFDYPGHTEFLASLAGVTTPVMMLAAGTFRIALITTHMALHDVPASLSAKKIVSVLAILHDELRRRFAIKRPRIAVTALNPHAGEGGAFGDEEQRIIAPAIEEAKSRGIDVSGPFAADALFARMQDREAYDVYVAMYHDQGLIPLKMRAQGRGVNYTCGLPFIRTSPDHGTAYDIAGQGKASPASFVEAINFALERIDSSEQGSGI